jgi:serine protease inhibitor
MRLARLAPAIVLLGALGGALPNSSLAPVPLLVADGVPRQRPAAGTPVATVATSIADLGYRMRTLADDGNWVASPLSVAYGFAMVRAGARGPTRAAIDRFFGFSDDVDSALNSVTARIATGPLPGKHYSVCISNGLFVQHGLPVGKPFLNTLASQYGTGVHPVDFGSGDAAHAINAWVRRQTAGKIKQAYDPAGRGDELVLANTVYLHADWAKPFTGTHSEPFHGPDGTVDVPTMRLTAELPYASGDGWESVDLPYAGSDLVMRILLPAPGGDPVELLRPPASAATAQPRRLELHLPKWTFSSKADLRELGPPELFGPDADLSGIIPGATITKADHQAYIAVDEKGTEAAAATTFAIATSGEVNPPKVVQVDRPFAFAIVHRPTGIPLFVGRVTHPGA